MSIQKLAHAELVVEDLEKALQFNLEVMGLTELARDNGVVYLGCGGDDNYDLALVGGGTGLSHFAFQVESEEDLKHYAGRLKEAGIGSEERTDGEPGQIKALRFAIPSGQQMELVIVEDRPHYLNPASPKHRRLRGIAPLDVDHITLRNGEQVKEVGEFLRDILDFRVSDVFEPAPGVWGAAWLHVGDYHHDLAIMGGPPGNNLDHLAWTMDGMDHIKKSADLLAQLDIPLETGPGRHGIGANLYGYFWSPGGNRYELSGEMSRAADAKAPTNTWSDFPKAFSAWGALPPESFDHGSGSSTGAVGANA